MLETGDGGEHGEGAKDLGGVAVLLGEVVERGGKLGEVGDGGAVVAAHAEEAGGLLGTTRDDMWRHVDDGLRAAGVRADTVAAELVAKPHQAAETDVDFGGSDGEAGLLQPGKDDVEVCDVLVEVGGGGLFVMISSM